MAWRARLSASIDWDSEFELAGDQNGSRPGAWSARCIQRPRSLRRGRRQDVRLCNLFSVAADLCCEPVAASISACTLFVSDGRHGRPNSVRCDLLRLGGFRQLQLVLEELAGAVLELPPHIRHPSRISGRCALNSAWNFSDCWCQQTARGPVGVFESWALSLLGFGFTREGNANQLQSVSFGACKGKCRIPAIAFFGHQVNQTEAAGDRPS
jgi:hypothetical protein